MKRKLISILSALAIFASTIIPTLVFMANADTIPAGSYPYAPDGSTYKPVVSSEPYKDFQVKVSADDLTDSNFYKKFMNTNTAKDVNFNSETGVYTYTTGNAVINTSLEAAADNVYGGTGKSLRVDYTPAYTNGIKPANLTNTYYMNWIRLQPSITTVDTASVGFWVKTDNPIYMCVRLTANSQDTNGFIISDRIAVPAGESFVEIPLACFKTSNAGYVLNGSTVKINNLDIYYSSQASFTGSQTLYLDHIGVYNYASNADKATHSANAIVKESVEDYALDGTAVKKTGCTWNSDSLGTINVSNADGQGKNANAIGGEGQSIYYSTTNVQTASNHRFRNNGSINTKDADNKANGVYATLEVWVKTDRAIKMFLTADDSTTSNSGKNRYQSDEHLIPAGETMLKIPLSEFDTQYVISGQTCDYNFKWDYLGSINFYFKAAVESADKNATVYVDSIAIVPGEIPAPDVPTTPANHESDFAEISLTNSKWTNKKTETSTITHETASSYYHKGTTNLTANNAAMKVAYTNISKDTNYINFYYNEYMRLSKEAPYIYESDSVISFWVRADQSVNITVTYMDYDNNSGKGDQAVSKTVTVPAGESIVKFKMSDFEKSTTDFDYRYAFQLQIRVNSNDASTKTSGAIYFDAFGFYDADTTNDIPAGSKPPEIPETVVTHDRGFSEIEPKFSNWVNSKPENATLTENTDAKRYHTGKTNVAANKTGLQVDYKNLSSTDTNVRFYYNEAMRLSGSAPYIFGENSVLSFWVYSEQSVKISIQYMDYSLTDSKSIQCKTLDITVPIGESIVKIPMKDLVPTGKEMEYRYAYQLLFKVYANDDSYTKESTLILDAFGFYDSSLVINDEPLTMPNNVLTWWNFDYVDGVDELEAQWTTRWEGETGEGIVASLENNSKNIYGKTGKSVKFVYNSKLAEYNQPVIWHENRFAALGDGMIFWIKSEEVISIKFICLDNNNKTCTTDSIQLTIGYNIVQIKYSDFKFTDTTLTGKPELSSLYQLQIRMKGSSLGTLWLDEIGFTNVKNDGSTAYYNLYPPTSYKDWEEGVSVKGEDFERFTSEDDYEFCKDWYFDSKGWVSLVKNGNNQMLKMSFDMTDNATSQLMGVTQFTTVDPNGGISFWAKSSEERYYTLNLGIGANTYKVIFKGDTKGRTYKIPFSALTRGEKNVPYVAESSSPVTITKITITSGISANRPAIKTSDKFDFYLDDIKFVDSLSFMRAADIDYTENGVTLKAPVAAFTTGVTPKISIVSLTDAQKKELLKKATGAKEILAQYNINVTDISGKNPIPSAEVEMIFDIPDGVNANEIAIYQMFVDGSLTKRKVTVGDDGKVHAKVYRLGDYIMAVSEKADTPQSSNPVDNNDKDNSDTSGFPWKIVLIIVGGVVVLAAGAVATLLIIRKGRGKK